MKPTEPGFYWARVRLESPLLKSIQEYWTVLEFDGEAAYELGTDDSRYVWMEGDDFSDIIRLVKIEPPQSTS